jgi:hypothetical protein
VLSFVALCERQHKGVDMRFIRALTEFAAAAANLHPDHRTRFDDLVHGAAAPAARAKSPAGHLDRPGNDVPRRRVG